MTLTTKTTRTFFTTPAFLKIIFAEAPSLFAFRFWHHLTTAEGGLSVPWDRQSHLEQESHSLMELA